ncbi:restriction endonuclease subunit S, partial [Psychrobacter sp. AOP5-GZ1-6]
ICMPSEELRQLFDSIVRASLYKIADRYFSNETLTKLRDTLLPKLMSGELRIPDAEKLVENI